MLVTAANVSLEVGTHLVSPLISNDTNYIGHWLEPCSFRSVFMNEKPMPEDECSRPYQNTVAPQVYSQNNGSFRLFY